ncbi:potassium/sodium hyperpolarization-activated cyclic nucleotide-gated channel 1 [Platysternon megacephalum]|uniref:Potassium/sodium hyperpolarization-activated cyclic nucleotide-gated channel 1 n=1 Tax=Platysternon megacephalum TaxID=55544 RepID=A0A4D9F290_9SAUR|nr:potassium/sodium hyperpolarization-activated cyclic nucleotide-gated channel 1 [Platysternon megacephalum]
MVHQQGGHLEISVYFMPFLDNVSHKGKPVTFRFLKNYYCINKQFDFKSHRATKLNTLYEHILRYCVEICIVILFVNCYEIIQINLEKILTCISLKRYMVELFFVN